MYKWNYNTSIGCYECTISNNTSGVDNNNNLNVQCNTTNHAFQFISFQPGDGFRHKWHLANRSAGSRVLYMPFV